MDFFQLSNSEGIIDVRYATEYIEFDTSPVNEDCVQVDKKTDYLPAMKAEARRMIELLDKKFPWADGNFRIKSQEHDFGTYVEIRYTFSEDEWHLANCIESNFPQTWEDDAVIPEPPAPEDDEDDE